MRATLLGARLYTFENDLKEAPLQWRIQSPHRGQSLLSFDKFMNISDLKPVITFIRAAELGTLREAALAQGITPQAASKAISHLEEQLGIRLFHRTTRKLSLTAEGQQFFDAMKPAIANIDNAFRQTQLGRDTNAGPLRIVGPRTSFRPLISKILRGYQAQYPSVQPDVVLDDNIGNWVADRVDVGFRLGSSPADGVIARRLLPLQLIVCAAPSYLQRYGAPSTLAELGNHRCSVYRHPRTAQVLEWNLRVGTAIEQILVAPAMSFNDEDLETDSILDGAVLGLMSGITAAAHIRAQRLIPILTAHVSDHYGVYLYYGSRVSQPTRVRTFIDYAVACCNDPHDFVLSPDELMRAEEAGRQAYIGKHTTR